MIYEYPALIQRWCALSGVPCFRMDIYEGTHEQTEGGSLLGLRFAEAHQQVCVKDFLGEHSVLRIFT